MEDYKTLIKGDSTIRLEGFEPITPFGAAEWAAYKNTSIIPLVDNSFLLAWISPKAESYGHTFVQRLDKNGTPLGEKKDIYVQSSSRNISATQGWDLRCVVF